MTTSSHAAGSDPDILDVFCGRLDDLWRVYVFPGNGLPPSLAPFIDADYESAPTLLDFEDLDEYMTAHHATYEKRVSTLGGVQLVARGESVRALADWLATAFASGIRRRSE